MVRNILAWSLSMRPMVKVCGSEADMRFDRDCGNCGIARVRDSERMEYGKAGNVSGIEIRVCSVQCLRLGKMQRLMVACTCNECKVKEWMGLRFPGTVQEICQGEK